jgi:MATE family multidrug resistance protein
MPMVGLSQAVGVLVGRRLGEEQPDRAEDATWAGLRLALLFTASLGAIYLLWPGPLTEVFHSEGDPEEWARVAALVPGLLRFVVLYCLFDAMNLVFSFALRGAGDTRFVSLVALGLSWPVMVVPTWAAWRFGWGLYAAWTFASLYIVLLSVVFLVRFLQGRWRQMRVIEPGVAS